MAATKKKSIKKAQWRDLLGEITAEADGHINKFRVDQFEEII